jgi:hypothetical protein
MLYGAAGTRRRWAHSLGQAWRLREAAVALVELTAALCALAALVARRSRARARLLFCLVAGCIAVAAQLCHHFTEKNPQADEDHPQRTWRDYAHLGDFRKSFRFAAADVPRLTQELGLYADEDAGLCTHLGYKFTAEQAISVLLYTLAKNASLDDVNEKFGIKRSKASAVLNWTLQTLHARWHLRLFCTDFRRWAPHFPTWAHATYRRQGRAGGYQSIVGFVDGTFNPTCRPGEGMQKPFFSGHKWDHGVHWQGVLAPNGLLIDLCGPF